MSQPRGGRRGQQRPPDCRPEALERAALRYLERFDSTSANLRSLLRQRVERALRRGAELDVESLHQEIEVILATYQARGAVDDQRFAETRLESLRRRGDSTRMVRHKLTQRGVPGELIDRVLQDERAEADEAQGDRELEAARTLLRRRRLGPHRPAGQRADNRQRDLAALARAGFSFDVARSALDEDADG